MFQMYYVLATSAVKLATLEIGKLLQATMALGSVQKLEMCPEEPVSYIKGGVPG